MVIELKSYERNSMANYGKQQQSLIKSRVQTMQTNLFVPKSLVGDEIQRREVETRRG
jgi:hypothetical protein